MALSNSLTIFRCSGAFIKAIAINLQVPQQINSRNRLGYAMAISPPRSFEALVRNNNLWQTKCKINCILQLQRVCVGDI